MNSSEELNPTPTVFSESQDQNTAPINIEEFGNQWIARQVEEYYFKWEKEKDVLHLLPNHLVVFLNANELAKTREHCEKLGDFKNFFNESCKALEKNESDKIYHLLDSAQKAEECLMSSDPRTGLFKALQVFDEATSKNMHVIQDVIHKAMEISKEKYCIGKTNNALRHEGAIKCVSVSHDGKYIISSGRDKKIFLWRSNGDYIHSTGRVHEDAIWKVIFSPCMNYIISASEDGTISLRHLMRDENEDIIEIAESATEIKPSEDRQGNKSIRSLAISPNGKYLVAGSKDYNAYLWELNKSKNNAINVKYITKFLHEEWVLSAIFSVDSKYIYCGCADKDIYCWEIDDAKNTQQKPRKLTGHTGWVRALAINEKYLVSGSEDKTIRSWKLDDLWISKEKSPDSQSFIGHEDKVLTVGIDPSGEFIISGSADKTIQLWDFYGNKVGYPLKGHDDWVRSLSVLVDNHHNKFVVSSSRDATIRIWDLQRNSLAKILTTPDSKRVISVAITHDEHDALKCIVSGGEDRTIHLWNEQGTLLEKKFVDYRAKIETNNDSVIGRHSQWIRSVRFTPDEKYIVTGSQDSSVGIWNFATDQFRVSTDTWNSNNATFETDKTDENKAWIRSIDISSDGQYLISASDENTFCLWDLNQAWQDDYDFLYINKLCFGKHNNRVTSVTFSPKEKSSVFMQVNSSEYIIASASEDKTIRLWDLNGNELKKLEGHTKRVMSVRFSSDGRYLVSGSQDKKIRLWDLSDLKEKNPVEYPPHEDAVRAIAFSPDSKFIISGSSDATIRLWDLYGNQIGSSLTGHRDSVRSIKVSRDGKFIVSGSEDGTIRLWNLGGLKDWVQICCDRIIDNPDSEPEHQKLAKKILSDLPNLAC